MQKIRMDLDELQVESFPTAAAESEHGTVQGQEASVVPAPCTGTSCSGPVACLCQTQDTNCA
jgi:hypothetical protein